MKETEMENYKEHVRYMNRKREWEGAFYLSLLKVHIDSNLFISFNHTSYLSIKIVLDLAACKADDLRWVDS